MKKVKIVLFLLSMTFVSWVVGQNTFQGTVTYYNHNAHGHFTASGERINMNDFVAAHKSLPFGTRIKVTNKKNDKSIIVRVIDRCARRLPYQFLDLSYGAAKYLDFISWGRISVTMQILDSALMVENKELLDLQESLTFKWDMFDSFERSSANSLLSIPDSTKNYAVIIGRCTTKANALQKSILLKKTYGRKTMVKPITHQRRKFFHVLAIDFANFEEAETFRADIIKKNRNAEVTRY